MALHVAQEPLGVHRHAPARVGDAGAEIGAGVAGLEDAQVAVEVADQRVLLVRVGVRLCHDGAVEALQALAGEAGVAQHLGG